MLPEDEILKLQYRCENLENVIRDIMNIIIDNKESGAEFPEFVGGDIQDLKGSFETLIKED